MDSLAVFVRLLTWDVAWDVAAGSFAVGWGDLREPFAGVAREDAATQAAGADMGDVALGADGGCRPLASSSACTFLVNFDGRVKMPLSGSHWK